MRDLISCFSENTIKVSDSSCSSSSSSHSHSSRNTVSCLYNTNLSDTQKQLLITVAWCKDYMGRGLSIDIHDCASISHNSHPSSCRFWKSKGSRSFQFRDSKINFFWDISSALYEAVAEPINNFHVVVVIDSQIGLLLGDMEEEEALKKFNVTAPIAHFFLVARKQFLFGTNVYSTKACFGDRGARHDIQIKCKGYPRRGPKDLELLAWVDGKKVIHVKRLQWKFRGNQMILVDGSLVDVMWDVHGWLFNPDSGKGIFVFRRSELPSCPCVDESSAKEEERLGFSMFIYACKSS